MVQLERMRDYPLAKVAGVDDPLDGPFVFAPGTSEQRFALLLSLRGPQGGALNGTQDVWWSRPVPAPMQATDVHVFVRRGSSALYLGLARFARRGKAGEPFKVTFTLADALDASLAAELVTAANAPLPPPADEALVALTPTSTADERLAALRVFVERWFGAATGDARARGPRALATFEQLTSGLALCVQNHLVHQVDDGRLVFYVENQGVTRWATDTSGDDPAVVRRALDDSRWELESEHLSSFLVGLVILEAAYGAPESAHHDALSTQELAVLARTVRPLATATWRASEMRFYATAGVIGFAVPNGPDWSVTLATKHREGFEPLERLLESWPE